MGALLLQQKFPTAPRLRLLTIWIQKRSPNQFNMRCSISRVPPSVSQKVPVNERPPGSPMGGPYAQGCPSPQPSFTSLSNSSIEVLLIKKKFHSKALWKQTAISRALLGISFGVPSKGALPPAGVLRSASNFPTRQKENTVIPKHGIKSEMDV